MVLEEEGGWFVISDSKIGPFPRELAESLAQGMAFAIRSAGGEARIVFGDPDEPRPDVKGPP
jgi:hypothetical protein